MNKNIEIQFADLYNKINEYEEKVFAYKLMSNIDNLIDSNFNSDNKLVVHALLVNSTNNENQHLSLKDRLELFYKNYLLNTSFINTINHSIIPSDIGLVTVNNLLQTNISNKLLNAISEKYSYVNINKNYKEISESMSPLQVSVYLINSNNNFSTNVTTITSINKDITKQIHETSMQISNDICMKHIRKDNYDKDNNTKILFVTVKFLDSTITISVPNKEDNYIDKRISYLLKLKTDINQIATMSLTSGKIQSNFKDIVNDVIKDINEYINNDIIRDDQIRTLLSIFADVKYTYITTIRKINKMNK